MVNHFARKWHWALIITVVTVLVVGLPAMQPATAAAPLDTLDISLKLVPADAAFYCTLLRNREQIEAIAGSRAWSKLKNMPVVQMGLAMYHIQAANPQGPAGQFKAAMENPEIQEIVGLLVEMTSDEVFFYGDESWVEFVQLMQAINGANQCTPLMVLLAGQNENIDQDNIQAAMFMKVLSDNIDKITVPNMVVGFKLKDTEKATRQLDKLEKLATAVLEAQEKTKGCFKKTEIAGHQYLVLSLDGKMIPWDELPMDELNELNMDKETISKMIDRIKSQKLVIALGVRNDYVLLSIGSSTDALVRLGAGKRLIDRPEFKPLEKFADKRITDITYISKAMCQQNYSQIDDMAKAVDEMLPMAELTDEQESQIRKDVGSLAAELKRVMPVAGPNMALSFLTDQGIEAYQYNWSRNWQLNGSKPLGLFRHVGGRPALAVVARGKCSPEDYDVLVKWIKVAYGYFQQYGLPQMGKNDREKFEKFAKLVLPLVERVDNANRNMLFPALADGQSAIVIDVQLTSKQFVESLPATEEPMPMIEPALVLGVSDAELLRKGCAEYQAVLDALIDVIRQMEPESIPEDFTIPRPKVAKCPAGTLYTYVLPEQWGVDEQIALTFGVSDSVAVASTSPNHTERLLEHTTPAVGGVLTDADQPRAVAVVFDWSVLLNAAKPWVDLAVEKITQQSEGNHEAVVSQVQTVMEVLAVLRKVTVESYFQDGALVSHSLTEFSDVEQ